MASLHVYLSCDLYCTVLYCTVLYCTVLYWCYVQFMITGVWPELLVRDILYISKHIHVHVCILAKHMHVYTVQACGHYRHSGCGVLFGFLLA